MFDLQTDLALAVRAAREAGALVMQFFRTDLPVTLKSPDQPVTEADFASDRLLRELLLQDRPAYGWLSEESPDSADRLGREHVWIVDPIDGTRSFIAGRREFTISIGLARAGEAVAGVVYNPATNELFSGCKGGGAYRDERRLSVGGGRPRNIVVASRSEIRTMHLKPFETDFEIQPLGSTAYKLAKVAEGMVDAFVSRGPKGEWDICAGDLLVREAGGRVTDLANQPLRFNRTVPQTTGVLAARPNLHEQIVHQLKGDV